MSKKEFIGKLTYYEHLNSSYYGNPRFYGEFTSESGEMLIGKTASDAACSYMFLNYPDEARRITYHITRNGNIIFDYIEVLRGGGLQ